MDYRQRNLIDDMREKLARLEKLGIELDRVLGRTGFHGSRERAHNDAAMRLGMDTIRAIGRQLDELESTLWQQASAPAVRA